MYCNKARENNMLIIHAPAGGVISNVVSPLENEIVLDSSNWIPDDKELHFILLKHDKKTLFYVGFHANMCILDRRYGTKRMHDLGYQVILLRDCTTGKEYHDTLEKMWVTRLAVREVEKRLRGYSCTAEEFIEGFAKQKPL
jgi:nicotinamidase-related amidase